MNGSFNNIELNQLRKLLRDEVGDPIRQLTEVFLKANGGVNAADKSSPAPSPAESTGEQGSAGVPSSPPVDPTPKPRLVELLDDFFGAAFSLGLAIANGLPDHENQSEE